MCPIEYANSNVLNRIIYWLISKSSSLHLVVVSGHLRWWHLIKFVLLLLFLYGQQLQSCVIDGGPVWAVARWISINHGPWSSSTATSSNGGDGDITEKTCHLLLDVSSLPANILHLFIYLLKCSSSSALGSKAELDRSWHGRPTTNTGWPINRSRLVMINKTIQIRHLPCNL